MKQLGFEKGDIREVCLKERSRNEERKGEKDRGDRKNKNGFSEGVDEQKKEKKQ